MRGPREVRKGEMRKAENINFVIWGSKEEKSSLWPQKKDVKIFIFLSNGSDMTMSRKWGGKLNKGTENTEETNNW